MHGGNIYEYMEKNGKLPMDFSASVSPFEVPKEVKRAAAEAMEDISRYPDPDCNKLREALAHRLGVDVDDILCGAGASDLIYRYVCALRPAKTMIITPAFSEYEKALRLFDCSIVYHGLREEDGFALDTSITGEIDESLDVLILNIPHNPTGLVPDKEVVEAILKRCDECNVQILSDECFIDFLDDPLSHTLIKRPNVTVLGALTKYHGLAGLRLGYVVSDDHELIEKMAASGPPWSVSLPAQAAGIRALDGEPDIRGDIKREREFLYDALIRLGFKVIPTEVNFLLFYSDDNKLYDKLYDRGILIRDCSDFEGLKKGWYRISVRTHEDNITLIDTLQQGAKRK